MSVKKVPETELVRVLGRLNIDDLWDFTVLANSYDSAFPIQGVWV